MKYEKLFQPGKIGSLELRNRVVMTAMGALMGDWNGCTTPEQIRFYEDRAKGGCGLIIPEFTSVDADSGRCTATARRSSSSCTTAAAKRPRPATAAVRPWLRAWSSTPSSAARPFCRVR